MAIPIYVFNEEMAPALEDVRDLFEGAADSEGFSTSTTTTDCGLGEDAAGRASADTQLASGTSAVA